MPKTSTQLNEEERNAIVKGYHSDPFTVLGPHKIGTQLVIRLFQPFADTAEVVFKRGKSHPMEKIDPAGLFELKRKGTAQSQPAYTFRLTDHHGVIWSAEDVYRFDSPLLKEGTDKRWYEVNGARPMTLDDVDGTLFVVWAPNAERVSLIGDFNNWDGRIHVMRKHIVDGLWELFMPNVGQGALYKYEIKTSFNDYTVTKTDPVGYFRELRPKTGAIVWDIDDYTWQDQTWVDNRQIKQALSGPMSVYEVQFGSWRRKGEGGKDWYSYNDLTQELVPYLIEMGYTHVELMPITEYPFDGSWGYQVTGYYAPTSRYGTPQEFMAFVDACHQNGIGVLLDWVPAHFPRDEHGLGFFDGTSLYEHADPRQGEHPDWGTRIFNYGREEVCRFLIDNALFWIDKYHIDGVRVDAVASMLYLDFSREPGQWVPNRYGGRENIEAINFLRRMNDAIHTNYPGVLTIAEESTAWPGVTRATDDNGGLGFDLKWNMGFMNDTLRYFQTEPIYRSFHQGVLTFSLLYAFSEKFVLAFSHDEVVHLKRSMLDKMPGDTWQKFANLRLLFGYQYGHPGRKLNFMGTEFGQWREWSEDRSLDWNLPEETENHAQLQLLVKDLNHTYKTQPALYENDDSEQSFYWIDFRDALHSVLIFARIALNDPEHPIIVACNFTPEVRKGYKIGVPFGGDWSEFVNTDHGRYGGSNVINTQALTANPIPWQDQPFYIQVDLPPLAVIYLKQMASK
ncbi:MAG: 1,4-alpha-glucan branching enzyme [Cellvibrionaceae bacterium]|jgi:1,4-alpha-glucan branching enzyme